VVDIEKVATLGKRESRQTISDQNAPLESNQIISTDALLLKARSASRHT